MPEPASTPPRIAAIMAAGKGTRMRSDLPKVLHQAAGRPLLEWVLTSARQAGCERLMTIVGHGADAVRHCIRGEDIQWVEQHQQLGTGHALAQIAPYLGQQKALVLVLSGDVPLVSAHTLERLAAATRDAWGAAAVAEPRQPGALGRVLTREDGSLDRVVEVADASPEERAIRRVNAGIYAFPAPDILEYLERLEPANAQGELYLTDVLGTAVRDGRRVALVELEDLREALGVNTRHDLALAHQALLARHLESLMDAGVTVLAPERIRVDPEIPVGVDTVLHPDVTVLGASRIGAGCVLHQGVWLRDTVLADGVTVEPYSVLDGARVAGGCSVGPFARLRPGTHLGDGSKVGNFVELKKTHLGAGAKASHLTYLGDATVGEGANIGAGTVTCNYDGTNKHPTTIGEGAFIGSDTMLVAPVEVGAGATTGAGSTITQNVPEGALGISRARQRTIEGWQRPRRRD